MAKPRAGSIARSAAAARASPAPTASDTNLPTPTSIPRADLSSSSGFKTTFASPFPSANRSSVGSSSAAPAADLPAPAASQFASVASQFASVAKEVGKRLAYEDDDDDDYAASDVKQTELVPEGLADLAQLLELPDPDDSSYSTAISASAADAATATATADSTVTQVGAPVDSTAAAATAAEGRVLTEMELVLAELHGARGLTPRSKRLLAALAETASAELSHNPTAAAIRTRRAVFWRKVRVGILAATVFSVAALDVAIAVALYGARRSNAVYSNVLPPT